MSQADTSDAPNPAALNQSDPSEHELVVTLFDLGRQVTAVLDFDELLRQIPRLIGRLISFEAFAVYLRDERRGDLRLAYAVGYPEPERAVRLRPGVGLVGAAVQAEQPLLVNDVSSDSRYVEFAPGMQSELVVPLLHKSRTIGALNILSKNRDQFSMRDVAIATQFAAHVAVAVVNAQLFERSRQDAEAFETLAEIGRDVASILDLDELFARIAQLTKRVIDYRTFGILLVNDDDELEMKLAVQYGEKVEVPRVRLGEGLVGYAALHKEVVLVTDVDQDPRYIKLVPDVRSELAIPLLLKDRCIGVLDLESPELAAFSKREVEILTLLASQAAVAIENARLYEEVRSTQERLEKEVRFAQRVQAALLPAGLPKRLKGVELAASFASARELGGDFHEYLAPESNTLVVAVGDVSGKGVPAALYSAFAAELVRGRTFRRRYLPERSSPAGVLSSVNTILHQRQLEEYLLHDVLHDLRSETPDPHAGELRIAVSDPVLVRGLRADRVAGRTAWFFPWHDLRRGHLRAARRRCLRVLYGRGVRSDECARPGVHGRAPAAGGWSFARSASERDRRSHLQGGRRLAR